MTKQCYTSPHRYSFVCHTCFHRWNGYSIRQAREAMLSHVSDPDYDDHDVSIMNDESFAGGLRVVSEISLDAKDLELQ